MIDPFHKDDCITPLIPQPLTEPPREDENTLRKKTETAEEEKLLHPHNHINVSYTQHHVCVLAPPGVPYHRQHSSNDFVNKLKPVNQD